MACPFNAPSQSASNVPIEKPIVGQQLPAFRLENIKHYNKKTATQNDFKGKWLFMHFWYKGCSSCIKNLERVDKFQKEFPKQTAWLLIGLNEKKNNSNVEEIYESIRKKRGIDLPSAYDSTIFNKWNIWSMPHIVIVNPDGIVKYITNGSDLSSTKIRDLIQNRVVTLEEKGIPKATFDADSVSSPTLLLRSTLTRWNGERYKTGEINGYYQWPEEYRTKLEYQVVMAPLHKLYMLAFLGSWGPDYALRETFYPKPILQIKDSSLFQFDYTAGFGLYNYSLHAPPEFTHNRDYLLQVMQGDLQRVFGFHAFVEVREVPVWKLVSNSNAANRLRAISQQRFISDDNGYGPTGFSARNISMRELLDRISNYLSSNQRPFVDESNIPFNIDIQIDAMMTDFDDVKKALNAYGLDLVPGTRSMKAIVITDVLSR